MVGEGGVGGGGVLLGSFPRRKRMRGDAGWGEGVAGG